MKGNVNVYEYAISLIAFLLCGIHPTLAQKETDFYKETWENGVEVNLVDSYGTSGSDERDDSQKLQQAIDELTLQPDGGKIIIPYGKYYLSNVALKSNVHLAIDSGTVIRPTTPGFVITVGKDTDVVKNVSIRGVGGMFIMDFTGVESGISTTGINCQNVDTFLIANMLTVDNYTVHSSIRFNMAEYNGGYFIARNGVVKNIDNTAAHVGYGTIQVGAGRNILFKDLDGDGGVTLRLESGAGGLDLLGATVFDIFARNITGRNGNCALMISPHAMKNGIVDADSIVSYSSRCAVWIPKGDTRNGDTPGYYSDSSSVSNITAYWGTTAQNKYGHFKMIPCPYRHLIEEEKLPDGKAAYGPASAAVIYEASGKGTGYFNVDLDNINMIGYPPGAKMIRTEADEVKYNKCQGDCLCALPAWTSAGSYVHGDKVYYQCNDYIWERSDAGNCVPGACVNWRSLGTCADSSQVVLTSHQIGYRQQASSCFPNPVTSDAFTIDINMRLHGAVLLQVYNASGSLIYSEQQGNYPSGYQTIPCSRKKMNINKQGIYLVRISTSRQTDVLRLVSL